MDQARVNRLETATVADLTQITPAPMPDEKMIGNRALSYSAIEHLFEHYFFKPSISIGVTIPSFGASSLLWTSLVTVSDALVSMLLGP